MLGRLHQQRPSGQRSIGAGEAQGRALEERKLDVTLPGAVPRRGRLHPVTLVERGEIGLGPAREAIIELGRGAGFEIDPIRLLIEGIGPTAVDEDLSGSLTRGRHRD